jgi:hypothetical protein
MGYTIIKSEYRGTNYEYVTWSTWSMGKYGPLLFTPKVAGKWWICKICACSYPDECVLLALTQNKYL